jgi:hypothetical protein
MPAAGVCAILPQVLLVNNSRMLRVCLHPGPSVGEVGNLLLCSVKGANGRRWLKGGWRKKWRRAAVVVVPSNQRFLRSRSRRRGGAPP